MTRIYHATLSARPNTRGMVSHRLKTISVVQTFSLSLFSESNVKALVAMVLHYHFSQFLLLSESPMMLPNFLNRCIILQALVGQVDNQNASGNTQILSYVSLRSGFTARILGTRGNKGLM